MQDEVGLSMQAMQDANACMSMCHIMWHACQEEGDRPRLRSYSLLYSVSGCKKHSRIDESS